MLSNVARMSRHASSMASRGAWSKKSRVVKDQVNIVIQKGATKQGGGKRSGHAMPRWPEREGEYIWGFNAVQLALRCAHRTAYRLFVLDEESRGARKKEYVLGDLEREARERGIPVMYQSKATLNQMAGERNTQGVVFDVGPVQVPMLFDVPCPSSFMKEGRSHHPLLVALDEVHDTHNFGAILRSCLLFGVDGVITCDSNAGS
jgi:tRNA G18 (ribose-2'-O)-methylase SpoU